MDVQPLSVRTVESWACHPQEPVSWENARWILVHEAKWNLKYDETWKRQSARAVPVLVISVIGQEMEGLTLTQIDSVPLGWPSRGGGSERARDGRGGGN